MHAILSGEGKRLIGQLEEVKTFRRKNNFALA